MGSFVAKIYRLTNMTINHISGQFHIFFPDLDKIYSLMVQAATGLYLLAKNTGAVHLRFYVCLDG